MVATKVGRRADPFAPETFTETNLRAWVDRSRRNLGIDTLDLVQLHCPPTPIFHSDAVFDVLDALQAEGAIAGYGVSVETCAEALAAIARPGVVSVQIILNAFRLKPLDEVLPAAVAAGVGIIARVPLASGLLSGKYSAATTFAADDHRNYNRRVPPSTSAKPSPEWISRRDWPPSAELTAALPDGVAAAGGRPALDHRAARRDDRDPGRPPSGAGQEQCCGRPVAGAAGGILRSRATRLRRQTARRHSSPLVRPSFQPAACP